ncbi:MAG TPA: DUF2723 domain-containing protein [Verrucomicrobiae bacterium]
MSTPRAPHFFDAVDWLGFAITSMVVFAIYLRTITPDLALGYGGIFATSALYGGPALPPGYPVQTLYSWAIIKLLPFGNIAFRVALASSLAGAFAAGLLALFVSSSSRSLWADSFAARLADERHSKILRLVASCSAGMGLGFERTFWRRAVLPDTWPLSVLLFLATLLFAMRWFMEPSRRKFLFLAAFVYGLAVTNSQALFSAALGLVVLIILAEPKVARDCCFVIGLFFVSYLLHNVSSSGQWNRLLHSLDEELLPALWWVVGLASLSTCIILTVKSRRLFTEWKLVIVSLLGFLLGLALYLYVPVSSMTNPPLTWGYPRTVTGFFHVLTRGQFERLSPASTWHYAISSATAYAINTWEDMGTFYLFASAIIFFRIRKVSDKGKRWMAALVAVCLCLGPLLVLVVNPSTDWQSRQYHEVFISISHVILFVWAGYGMILVGSRGLVRLQPVAAEGI